MGANSYLLAIGKFKKKIAECLDYPAYYYDDVPEGTIVTSSLFHCETTDKSDFLAHWLQLDDHTDLANAYIENSRMKQIMDTTIPLTGFIQFLVENGWSDLLKLQEAGFDFIFMPEC